MDKVILITYDKEDAVNEAKGLCEAAGYEVVHIIQQNYLQKPKYGISGGVLEQLQEIADKIRPDVIVFDEILKPSQNYNLATELQREVLDREGLILEIFESRASSAESKLQVKLAQLRYEMVRAKEKVRLANMGEQPGFMGIGQFEIDVYYNDIKHRMQTVKKKLEKAGKQRELHRQGRKRMGFATISLAGYTSAGKTTLFNKTTGETKTQSKELFTTLSTTTRRIIINQEPVLIADTVGFISKLPAYMIDAFKSTLEELTYSDIIILVIDVSDSQLELRKKFASCMRTLDELGVKKEKIIYALNKSDLMKREQINYKTELLNLTENEKVISVSSKTGENIKELKKIIEDIIVNQEPALIADTVGFISKLPAYMIDAFKSTLEELTYSDIIILVIDISDSQLELRKKFASCMRTLDELGVKKEKIIYALNKSDLMKREQINYKTELLNLTENEKVISVSSKTGENIKELKKIIEDIIVNQNPYKYKKNKSEGAVETFGY